MTATLQGGNRAKTLDAIISQFSHSFIYYFHASLRKRLFAVAVSGAVAIVPFAMVPLTAHSEYSTTPTATVELSLSAGPTVFTHPTTAVVVKPGESNATLEHQASIKKANARLQVEADATEVAIRDVDVRDVENIIVDFLASQHSPFANYAHDLIEAADQHNVHPFLLIGISGAESSFGLAMPSGSHNPFGLGPTRRFASFPEAFEAEAQFLSEHYIVRGVANPYRIGPSYTGTGSTTWGASVASFMARI